MKYDTAGTLTTFMQPSGYANGMTFDGKGHLIAAADEKNEMWSIDIATKKATRAVQHVRGQAAQRAERRLGASDHRPDLLHRSVLRSGSGGTAGPKENPRDASTSTTPADKRLSRVIDDMMQPNGIIGTPDGKTLYVADIRGRQTFVYDINADGTLGNKRLFCGVGSDGMTIDSEGNVYLTTGRAVQVFDRTGQRIETIAVPESRRPTSCFGGTDTQTLFITARTGLLRGEDARAAASDRSSQRWMRADPPLAKARTCSSVAIVVSPGNVVISAPCAQPSLTACSAVSPVSRP